MTLGGVTLQLFKPEAGDELFQTMLGGTSSVSLRAVRLSVAESARGLPKLSLKRRTSSAILDRAGGAASHHSGKAFCKLQDLYLASMGPDGASFLHLASDADATLGPVQAGYIFCKLNVNSIVLAFWCRKGVDRRGGTKRLRVVNDSRSIPRSLTWWH